MGAKIFMIISFDFLEGLVHVISTSRPTVETSSAYYLAYTRNFRIKNIALNSSRLGEFSGAKYKELFLEFVVI